MKLKAYYCDFKLRKHSNNDRIVPMAFDTKERTF